MQLIRPDSKRSIAADLRRLLKSDQVKDDVSAVTAYAVDAGIYRIVPQAVALPESEADIEAVLSYASRHGVPLTPRAAGTNLTGSAIGPGIILDVSRLSRVLAVNKDEKWARVQPGVVYAELNRRLAGSGLLFGPDPSSGDMCKLGGMLANNSSGPHTLRYGSVKDNVVSLRVCLESSGWLEARSCSLDSAELEGMLDRHPQLGAVLALVQRHAEVIRRKRPAVTKNSSGYNVFALLDGLERRIADLPRLFIGSEGTLGIISEATLALVDLPPATATMLIDLRDLEAVGAIVPDLLALRPSALEVMDRNTLDLIGRKAHRISPDTAALLLMELDGPDGRQVADLVQKGLELCRRHRLAAEPAVAFDRDQRDALWRARKALYPTLYRYDRQRKPINYVDDVVVPAGRLGELIRYLEDWFGAQRIPVAIFGHIGNGNAHIVPLLDLNAPDDFRRMVDSYRAIHQTVLTEFGGSICGEHGDGRVRAELVRAMFGDELYGLFVQLKQSLDPANVLNPGVKISERPFTADIDYTRLSKSCATCGKCNAVCPVYDVFQSEDMSSRGWYEIVTAADYSYLNSKRVVEACLNCKSCRSVCPAGVDVADLILQRRAEHPNRLMGWIFRLQARPRVFAPLVKLAASTQALWDRRPARVLLEWISRPLLRGMAATARIPRDFVLPRLARRTLRERHAALIAPGRSAGLRPVAYFHGCAANYFDDGVGDAVIEVLKHRGLEPALPAQRCSGTPLQTYGHVELAREGARENLAALEPYEMIVTGCASCTLMLKDYPALFEDGPEREAARRLAGKVRHIAEVIAEQPEPNAWSEQGRREARPRRVTYHSSCHLRAAGVSKAPRDILGRLPGVTFTEMADADRCAGGAGTFVIKDYDTSQRIFERKRRAIDASMAEEVVTSCPACMIQLRNGLPDAVAVKHLAQVVLEADLARSS